MAPEFGTQLSSSKCKINEASPAPVPNWAMALAVSVGWGWRWAELLSVQIQLLVGAVSALPLKWSWGCFPKIPPVGLREHLVWILLAVHSWPKPTHSVNMSAVGTFSVKIILLLRRKFLFVLDFSRYRNKDDLFQGKRGLLLERGYSALSNTWVYNLCKNQNMCVLLGSVVKINVFKVSHSGGCDSDRLWGFLDTRKQRLREAGLLISMGATRYEILYLQSCLWSSSKSGSNVLPVVVCC